MRYFIHTFALIFQLVRSFQFNHHYNLNNLHQIKMNFYPFRLYNHKNDNIEEKFLEDLDILFDRIKDMKQDEIPIEIQQQINNKIQQNAPNNMKIKLDLLGFTPLTIAGFILAGVIILLNNILGNGWASDLLKLNNDQININSMNEIKNDQLRNKLQGGTIINYDDILLRTQNIYNEEE